jgi:hypothetical protein
VWHEGIVVFEHLGGDVNSRSACSIEKRLWWAIGMIFACTVCGACECSVRFEAGGTKSVPAPDLVAPHPPPPVRASPGLTAAKAVDPEPSLVLGPTHISGGPAEVEGSLPKRKVSEIIERHYNELRFCHEGNRRVPSRVQLVLALEVSGTGAVQQAKPEAAGVLDPTFMECIATAARRWTFSATAKKDPANVRYPVAFDRAPQ